METLIPLIIPFVFAQHRHAVNMHPVSAGLTLKAWIAEQRISGSFIKAKLFKMITSSPAPENISLPVYLNNFVINQTLI